MSSDPNPDQGQAKATGFYSVSAARRGLNHFVLGKLLSAALGLAFLFLSVRAMVPAQYGVYITLLAAADLFYLVTGCGLSTIAQRYVAEYRLRATAGDFVKFLRRQFLLRGLYSLLALLLLVLLWEPAMRLSGLQLSRAWLLVVCLLLFASAGMSFLEEVLGACLLQGYAQGLAVGRNLFRVAAVLWGARMPGGLSLEWLVWAEALAALGSWLAAEGLVRSWARNTASPAQAQAGYHAPAMASVARRFFVVQLAGQAYGSNITKMIVMRLLGAVQAASYGVAQSMADMVRNYMPAHLLAGWVRPLMVARYVQHRDLDELSTIVNLVLKINLLGLLPLAALSLVGGDDLIAWISKGKYPGMGGLLAVLLLGLVFQTAHLLLSMVTLTLEAPAANLRATFAACLALPVLWLLVKYLGVMGAALSVLVTEGLWIGVAWWCLRQRGFHLKLDLIGSGKIAVAALLAAFSGSWAGPSSLVMALVTVLVFTVVAVLLKPASPRELQLVRQLLPARFRASS